MNGGDASEPQIETAGQPPIIASAFAPAGPKPFSTGAIILFAALALAAFVHRNWLYLTSEPIARLSFPGTAALWVLHENMLFHDGVNKLSRGWQGFIALMGISARDVPEHCEEVLREAIRHLDLSQHDPTTADHLRASLVVLLAEHGSTTDAMAELELLSQSAKARDFRRAFETGFATNAVSMGWSPDRPGNDLLSGWAAWRFTTRWLQVTADEAELERHEASVALGERQKVWPCVGIFGLAWMVQLSGLFSLILLAVKKPFKQPVWAPLQEPPWPLKEYGGLFVLGFLLGILAEQLFVRLPVFGQLAWLSHCLVWGLPTVVLLGWRHWFRDPLSFCQFFGIPRRLEGFGWLVIAGLALFALNWLTLIWIPTMGEAIGFKSHWAEEFDEVLATWPWHARIIHLFDGIISGPLMEEIIFRGLLFGALRTRLSLYPAAGVSALVFGGTHFYSFAGFLSVSLFGFWCALAREKTGSLLPPIATHMLTNLFLFGSQAVMGF